MQCGTREGRIPAEKSQALSTGFVLDLCLELIGSGDPDLGAPFYVMIADNFVS